jgi:hypothetical protein
MKMQESFNQTMQLAVAQLLRPLFRLLLRNGMSLGVFEEIARKTFVDVAFREFNIPGKKPSVSRTSILSGLSRKEVQRLIGEPVQGANATLESHNRAARVISGWVRDPEFLDAKRQPSPLNVKGPISFDALVKRHSGDMPTRAVLDELIRVGAVHRREDGLIELLVRAYVPHKGVSEKLGILGADVADLIATIDHNLQDDVAHPKFQRKVMYHSMPADVVPAFKKLSSAQAQALLEKLDRWLASQAAKAPEQSHLSPQASATSKVRVGLGIYYVEEHIDSTFSEKGNP